MSAVTIAFVLGVVGLSLAAFMAAPKGWRTVWSNIAVAAPTAVGLILDFLQTNDFSAIMSTEQIAWMMLAVNVLNIFLRSITDSPIGKPL